MINVIIKKKSGKYSGFLVKGHAGYAKAGKDIICAATSVLVVNTVNSLEKLTNVEFDIDENEKEGYVNLDFKTSACEKSELLMDSLVLGLEGIKEGNEKYIKISFKEV